jgi:hypothetical protein
MHTPVWAVRRARPSWLVGRVTLCGQRCTQYPRLDCSSLAVSRRRIAFACRADAAVSWDDANSAHRQCLSCHVLHGAGAEGKVALSTLTQALSAGRRCGDAFEVVRARRHYAPRGSASEALLLRVRDACCNSSK